MSAAPTFHPLVVSDIEPLTDESVAVTFAVPDHLSDTFTYLPGQHVTVRSMIDGDDVRRSYSICANANTGVLRVGIKRLEGGVFSTWATKELQVGDVLDVMPPVGEFIAHPDPERSRSYGAIAAGSGITPVLSLAWTLLDTEQASTFTLIYGNRETGSIMFLEEVEALKDRFPTRFQLVHVLSRESQVIPLFEGRIDHEKLEALFAVAVDPSRIDEWFLCGPYGMVTAARGVLEARGVEAHLVHDELFFAGDAPPLPPQDPTDDTEGYSAVRFTLDGRTSVVAVDPEGHSILDHALTVRRDLPFSCKGGVCATCKAKVISGDVAMDQNWALVPEEVDAGLVLTCQAHPRSETVELDYDV